MLKQDVTPEWFRAVVARCTGTQKPLDRAKAPVAPMADIIVAGAPIAETAATLPSIDEMQQIFSTACRQRLDTIFANAKLCHFIKTSYSRGDQLQIIDGAMDRPRFDKLAKVAADERLGRIEQRLPASETTIILLSNFTDAELAAACQAGIIHPAATRRALAEWRREQRRAAHGDAVQQPSELYAVVWRAPNAQPETIEALKRLIDEVRALPGVDVTHPRH
jgi:hypothetical protein